jgi:hypothetical protein
VICWPPKGLHGGFLFPSVGCFLLYEYRTPKDVYSHDLFCKANKPLKTKSSEAIDLASPEMQRGWKPQHQVDNKEKHLPERQLAPK